MKIFTVLWLISLLSFGTATFADESSEIEAEEFTADELKVINAFYLTDAGKKTIEKMPYLMQKGMQMGEAQFYAHVDELEEMLKAEVERVTNKHSLEKQRENSI